jgi:hypothetical protein
MDRSCCKTHGIVGTVNQIKGNISSVFLPTRFSQSHNLTFSCVFSQTHSTDTKFSDVCLWSTTKSTSIVVFGGVMSFFASLLCVDSLFEQLLLFEYDSLSCHSSVMKSIVKSLFYCLSNIMPSDWSNLIEDSLSSAVVTMLICIPRGVFISSGPISGNMSYCFIPM